MIRNATLEDMEALLRHSEALHAESRFRGMHLSLEKMRGLFTELIAGDGGQVFVAETAGRVVGSLPCALAESYFGDDLMAYEYYTYVEPAHRGGVAGPRMLQAYVAWARACGAVDINAGVTTGITTDRTAALYERLGGERVGALFSWAGVRQ